MKATVTAKGQITLPAKLRRKLGLEVGTVLEFDEHASVLLARKATRRRSARAVIGCLATAMPESVAAYLDETRGTAALPPRR
ncbi:MAG: AbrB/MazE/SpoVT family DNA-binding domain-containing protein [Opitutaceae bacterium]